MIEYGGKASLDVGILGLSTTDYGRVSPEVDAMMIWRFYRSQSMPQALEFSETEKV